MIRALLTIIRPFHSIARSLRTIAELYEADMNSRQIYRMTERAHSGDTEVSYSGVVEEKKPKYRMWS